MQANRTLKSFTEVGMKGMRVITDIDEILYARKIAMFGKERLVDGCNYYGLTKVRFLKDLPGIVVVGGIVETEFPRERQGKDQDFGQIKIMFYVLFDKHQTEIIKRKYPETKTQYFDHDNRQAVILTWEEFKEAMGKL